MFSHEGYVLVTLVEEELVAGDEPCGEADGESYDEVEGSGQ